MSPFLLELALEFLVDHHDFIFLFNDPEAGARAVLD
jgi:hypothetical protein